MNQLTIMNESKVQVYIALKRLYLVYNIDL